MNRVLTGAAVLGLFSAAVLPAVASPAPLQLTIDKTLGKVAGWSIAYSESLGGCLAAATYGDDTTIWFGFNGSRGTTYLAFTNPKWRSVGIGGQYQLRLATNVGNRWQGMFTGFEYGDAPGVFQTGLKDRFIADLSNAGLVSLELSGRRIASLSLVGSTEAFEAVLACQKDSSIAKAKAGGTTAENKGGVGPSTAKSSHGTGFYVSARGHVMTNQHVIDGCKDVTVSHIGAPPVKARLVASDAMNDLAVLSTDTVPSVVPPLAMRARVGETVYAYGFPLSGILATTGNFTIGNVTATAGLNDDTRHIQISAPVQPGNSGGPLVDQFGNVVGIIVGKLNVLKMASITSDLAQNVNFAIKTTTALNFLETNSIDVPINARTTDPMDGGAIAERAKAFTVRVSCQ